MRIPFFTSMLRRSNLKAINRDVAVALDGAGMVDKTRINTAVKTI